MGENNNIKKLETFFEDDLRVKKLLNDIIPNEMDFYDDDSKFKYANRVLEDLNKIKLYIARMLLNYNLPNSILVQFETKINELQKYINSRSFYKLLEQGYNAVLNFIHSNVGDMRVEFVDSVQKGFIGYYLFYGNGVLDPITINEFLHYIHSYIINNENFYSSIPVLKASKHKDWGGISLRGIPNEFGNALYDGIVSSNLDSDCVDIINLDRHILIMARDLGHATVIEVELEDEDVFVKYYIPKNNNKDMVSKLKGINLNKDEFAIGDFQTTRENFITDLCSLMKKIPTDSDRIGTTFNM